MLLISNLNSVLQTVVMFPYNAPYRNYVNKYILLIYVFIKIVFTSVHPVLKFLKEEQTSFANCDKTVSCQHDAFVKRLRFLISRPTL